MFFKVKKLAKPGSFLLWRAGERNWDCGASSQKPRRPRRQAAVDLDRVRFHELFTYLAK